MLADRDPRQVGRAGPVLPIPAFGARQQKRLFAVQAIGGTLLGLGMNADIGHITQPDPHFGVCRIDIQRQTTVSTGFPEAKRNSPSDNG